jgi:hypothetical protein
MEQSRERKAKTGEKGNTKKQDEVTRHRPRI